MIKKPELIHQILEYSRELYPHKTAVIHVKESFTYQQVDDLSGKIADYLIREEQIKKGQRVAILLRNSIHYIVSYYGALKTGAVAVPLNTGLNEQDISEIVHDCTPQVLITETFFKEKIKALKNSFSDLKIIIVEDSFNKIYSNPSPTMLKTDISPDDLASIIYTSGSTGKPKGVMLTHKNIISNTESIVSYLKLTSEDKIMVVLPFYYVYGKSLLNTHFYVGGTVVIENRFLFPNLVLNSMIKHKVTGFSGVPSTFSILLNKSSLRKMKFPDLRYLTQAGGHMPRSVKEELLKIFPDKKIFIMYGATEASARLSYLEPEKLPEKIDSIGKPIPGVKMKVVDDKGNELPPNKEGEIIVTGPNIMKGYWNRPDETEKVLRNGWYYTGDIGYMDDEGYFYVSGRKRDMIKVGIHKVSAKEIEEVLYRHPQIAEAAVVGIPDDVTGEAIMAFIVSNNGSQIDENEVVSFCSKYLPQYKLPKSVRFLKSLPKNESGKILKNMLNFDLKQEAIP